jgi:predicted ATP-binding protein involved in virulence
MKIKNIEITNVKGIGNNVFNLDLVPNKPIILVAPNGFGKSSFSIAFDSLKKSKIELDQKHYHNDDDTNRPILSLTIEDSSGQRTIVANDTSNSINNDFDVFVINSQLMAKPQK